MFALILDCETSGLISNRSIRLEQQPHVIEFYATLVDLSTGKVHEEADWLIKPPIPISDEITRITGITDAMLKDAEPFSTYAPKILTMISYAPLLIAHNASFDREMIDLEFERLNHTIQWPRLLCTVEATVHLKGFRLTLGALHEHLFNEPFVGAHRAKQDVQALIRCAVELVKRGDL